MAWGWYYGVDFWWKWSRFFFPSIWFTFCIEARQCLSFLQHLGLGSTPQVAPLQPLGIGSFIVVTHFCWRLYAKSPSHKTNNIKQWPRNKWWFQICFIFTPNLGEDSHFDKHIFQKGWFNHQVAKKLVNFFIRVVQFVELHELHAKGVSLNDRKGCVLSSVAKKDCLGNRIKKICVAKIVVARPLAGRCRFSSKVFLKFML